MESRCSDKERSTGDEGDAAGIPWVSGVAVDSLYDQRGAEERAGDAAVCDCLYLWITVDPSDWVPFSTAETGRIECVAGATFTNSGMNLAGRH
jgi:hypothetical protein